MIDLSNAKPGDEFVTKDGTPAIFVGTVNGAKKNGANWVFYYPKDNRSENLWPDGSAYRCSPLDERDIISRKPVKHKLTGWVNVYPDGSGQHMVHLARKAADAGSTPRRCACIDLSKYNIEYTEGEGL